jgi:hypothetical protein
VHHIAIFSVISGSQGFSADHFSFPLYPQQLDIVNFRVDQPHA